MAIMFVFEEPLDLNDDWYLGDKNKCGEKLPNEFLKNISNVHMVGIQYLFENYAQKRGGVVLNEDEDLNMPLQVCAFLCSVKERINEKSPVLIISNEHSLCKWHYHACEVGFEPQIIESECKFDDSGIYILNSESLKLAVHLLDHDLFCVVMDDFDIIATKLLVKKLKGSFNIGLTTRNFYKQPDQKLKWSMINWASPGCVGKLNDFYRIDRLHSLAFSDNYRFWWKRLTWKFCDSFEPPSEEDLKEYHQKLQQWGELHNIKVCHKAKSNLKRTREKRQPTRRKKKAKYDAENADKFPNFPDSSLSTPSSLEEISMTENCREDSEEAQEMKKPNVSVLSPQGVKTEPTENSDTDEEIFSISKNYSNKIEKSVPLEKNLAERVKTECSEETKDEESGEDEPILSLIYSQTPSLSENFNNASNSLENESKFLPSLDTVTCKSQTFQQISDVLDNLSDVEGDTEVNSDEDSFFSELITGRK